MESFTQPSTFDEIVLGTQVSCTPGASQVCVCSVCGCCVGCIVWVCVVWGCVVRVGVVWGV